MLQRQRAAAEAAEQEEKEELFHLEQAQVGAQLQCCEVTVLLSAGCVPCSSIRACPHHCRVCWQPDDHVAVIRLQQSYRAAWGRRQQGLSLQGSTCCKDVQRPHYTASCPQLLTLITALCD